MEQSEVQNTKILLVEDDDSHALLVQWIFEESDKRWKVSRTATIGDARRWIEAHKGEDYLVITDYRLPDGTGLDLTGGVARPDEMMFPLIIITGVGSEKLAVQSMKSGAMDYVVKGDDLQSLPQAASHVIREWVKIKDRRQAERSLIEYINGLERSSADLDEFLDKIGQYLETSMSCDHEINKQLIERFKKMADGQGSVGTGRRHGMVDALDLLSKDGLEGAMMMVDLELSKNPDSWEAWSSKADILYLQERYFESLNACNTALQLNPENALAWNTKGNALYRLDRYDQAIECYTKAIEISPLFPKSWYNKKMALEVQLKKSMSKISLRSTSINKITGSGSGRRSGGDRRSGDSDGDDKGDGSLRVSIGKIK